MKTILAILFVFVSLLLFASKTKHENNDQEQKTNEVTFANHDQAIRGLGQKDSNQFD